MTGEKRAAFAALYERYFPKVFRYVYGSLLNHAAAEDVTADIFFTAFAAFDRYDEERGSAAWLGAIARNKVLNYFKKAYVRHEILHEKMPEQAAMPEFFAKEAKNLRDPESRELFRRLQKLPEDERDFLALRYGLELTNGEIAALVGSSAEAVRMRYARLIEKCRRCAE